MSLGYIAEMSLWDESGRCKCPCCGKFRKRSDIPDDQQTSITSVSSEVVSHVHISPSCKYCLETNP